MLVYSSSFAASGEKFRTIPKKAHLISLVSLGQDKTKQAEAQQQDQHFLPLPLLRFA
jgi:hypothetical protein